MESCLGFNVDCGTLVKGAGVTLMGFILFVGSVYLILTAVLGRWMGYLVLMVAFSGWMILLSAMWAFGFYSQGPDTPVNLGPRGAEPSWVPLLASTGETSDRHEAFGSYPEEPWKEPGQSNAAEVQSLTGIVTDFLAEEANAELEIEATDPRALTGVDFAVDDVRFATVEGNELAVAEAHFLDGGPLWTVSLEYDEGSVPKYSYMFLAGSVILFAVHLPLLDIAERKRKDFLTGGAAPPWYGPA
ncbi:MAG TPA: hypothetical protein VMR89_05050 [Actinomycetota bacterium]|nr:hypothetical protein [Actinomycetota bacterium]